MYVHMVLNVYKYNRMYIYIYVCMYVCMYVQMRLHLTVPVKKRHLSIPFWAFYLCSSLRPKSQRKDFSWGGII